MQYGRHGYSAAIMNNKIFVAGGRDMNSLVLSSVECYDPIEGKWTEVARMNFPRTGFALVESNGRLYAMGHHKSIERYDSSRNVWTVVSILD